MGGDATREADAAREAESLAETRRELEEKTAELIRLKGVLRGKLLARVTEEVDAAREARTRWGDGGGGERARPPPKVGGEVRGGGAERMPTRSARVARLDDSTRRR